MGARWQFRPGFVVTLATIAFCALTVALGLWQTRRAAEKDALQAALDLRTAQPTLGVPPVPAAADAIAMRRVAARGEYVERFGILLDNKVLRGRVGYQVVTPLRLAGGNVHVLVNRGWAAAGRTREDVPQVPVPRGPQTVEGIAVLPPTHVYEVGPDAPRNGVWQNLVLERYRAWSALELAPFVLQQTNDAGDGLAREWERPDAGADRHRSYALQWFSLAALALVLYVVLNTRRRAGGGA
jgi:surfeit locus 1 family protein